MTNLKKPAAWRKFLTSIWFFPAILTLILLLLTAFSISGSSIGIYHSFLYGSSKDPNLLINRPEAIRSDEWLVTTQMTLAQKTDGFASVNKHLGSGEDVSLIIDTPYKDWSILFKPQNLAFFVLPFDNAFAFRWWFIGYVLILSCYFFVLNFLPGRKLLAAALGLGIFCAPFIQWWYLSDTLGVISYSLLGVVILTKILRSGRLRTQLWWSLALTYVMISFILLLYPPFQIACALVILVVAACYTFEMLRHSPRAEIAQKLALVAGAMVVSGVISLAFFASRWSVVQTIENSAYPGHRLQDSGGFDAVRLLSGNLQAPLEHFQNAIHYNAAGGIYLNQSEASNFVLLLPFFVLPSFYLLIREYRKRRRLDLPLLSANVVFLALLVWLFVPHLDIIGHLTLLDRVPHQRLVIGLGLLGFVQLVLFMRYYASLKAYIIDREKVLLYIMVVLITEFSLGIINLLRSPGYIGPVKVIAYSLPIPVVMYLFLRKRFEWAAIGLFMFSAYMVYHIHPLYRGLGVITDTPLSKAIQTIAHKDQAVWAAEGITVENFAFVNGAPSLSGVYAYPQLNVWRDTSAPPSVYNRYAHVTFAFNRSSTPEPTVLKLGGQDNFQVQTDPCSNFLRQHNVHYLLTETPLNMQDSCLTSVQHISYPAMQFYIYHVR